MIRTLEPKQTPFSNADKSEFCRIISAAVINTRFCQDLLDNPQKAVAAGYRGESFNLGKDQTSRLSAIRVSSLAEFAARLA